MDSQALTIRPARWSDEAAAALARALPYADVSELQTQTENGAALFAVEYQGREVAWYVLRIDMSPERIEGVILAAGGGLHGVDLTASTIPYIERQFRGCDSIRLHTARPGVVKKLTALGYGAGEIILRKTL